MKYLIIILLFASCYSVKKASHQLDKAHSHYPAMVAEKTRTWFPCIETGSTDTVEIILAPEYDYYMKYIDSLLSLKAKVEKVIVTQYKDTCKSAVNSYNAGFNLGYEVGKYEGLRDCVADTIKITRTVKVKDMAYVEVAYAELVAVKKQLAKVQKSKTRTGTVALIGWILFILAGIFIYFKNIR